MVGHETKQFIGASLSDDIYYCRKEVIGRKKGRKGFDGCDLGGVKGELLLPHRNISKVI